MMWWHMAPIGGWGWGWMVGGWLMMVAFWAVIIFLVVWAVRTFARPSGLQQAPSSPRSPLDIAKERYARGEITREEFEEIRRTLEGS